MKPQTMLVVVGAGASYDCLTDYPPGVSLAVDDARPPLTKDLPYGRLVNDLLQKWPGASQVIEFLRNELGDRWADRTETLEAALKRYEGSVDAIPERGAHLLYLRFLLRDLLQQCTDRMLAADGGITNYSTLVRRLREWSVLADNRRVVIVSFNYDVLVEDALARNDPAFATTTLTSDTFSIVKPHGSIRWALQFPSEWVSNGDLGTLSVGRLWRDYAHLADKRSLLTTRDLHAERLEPHESATASIPALALPLDGKSDFVCPEEQLTRLDALAPGYVTHLLTIGWRAAEPHFLERLRPMVTSTARGLVVTGGSVDEAQEVADRLAGYLDMNPADLWRNEHGFSELLRRDNHDLNWLLDD